jgi:hypothetical protein
MTYTTEQEIIAAIDSGKIPPTGTIPPFSPSQQPDKTLVAKTYSIPKAELTPELRASLDDRDIARGSSRPCVFFYRVEEVHDGP